MTIGTAAENEYSSTETGIPIKYKRINEIIFNHHLNLYTLKSSFRPICKRTPISLVFLFN